jgi:hypothetical protein
MFGRIGASRRQRLVCGPGQTLRRRAASMAETRNAHNILLRHLVAYCGKQPVKIN